MVKLFATSRSKVDELIKNSNHANIVVMQVQVLVGCLKGAVECQPCSWCDVIMPAKHWCLGMHCHKLEIHDVIMLYFITTTNGSYKFYLVVKY